MCVCTGTNHMDYVACIHYMYAYARTYDVRKHARVTTFAHLVCGCDKPRMSTWVTFVCITHRTQFESEDEHKPKDDEFDYVFADDKAKDSDRRASGEDAGLQKEAQKENVEPQPVRNAFVCGHVSCGDAFQGQSRLFILHHACAHALAHIYLHAKKGRYKRHTWRTIYMYVYTHTYTNTDAQICIQPDDHTHTCGCTCGCHIS